MPLPSEVARASGSIAELLSTAQWGAPWRAAASVAGGVPAAVPPAEPLDLRYAPDEAPLLDPDPDDVWAAVLGGAGTAARLASHYAVDDPYGAVRGASAVSAFFDTPLEDGQVTFGAGVTALLHDLAPLAAGRHVLAPALVHSDLEVWGASLGSTIRLVEDPMPWQRVREELHRARVAVLHLDRPTFTGALLPLDALERIANAAAATDTIVIVDESPAPYLGARASAVQLVPRVDNLVVLRGFTKAYSLGGMRAGFAVASRELASRVRELATPLQISEIALAMSVRLLEAGDACARLVARIRTMKPTVHELLRSAGLPVVDGHPDLPWIAIRDETGVHLRWLERQGIRALLPTTAVAFPDAFRTTGRGTFRITIPLSAGRLSALRERLEPWAAASPA